MSSISQQNIDWGATKKRLFNLMGYEVKHPKVIKFHESKAKTRVIVAPRRGSKSWSVSHDVLAKIIVPNTKGWIVGPSYDLAEKEFRYIHQRLVIEREKLGLPRPVTCATNVRTGQLYIKFPWGSTVEGKSAGRPDSLLGEALDWVIYSEAAMLPRMIRERYVEPTLITTQGEELIGTTPSMSAEWVHELFIAGQEGIHPEIESFHWGVQANPTYPMEEFYRARKFYGAEHPVFREQYLGEWVFYGGMVYPNYNPAVHVIDPFDIPKDWPVLRAIDFGSRDPFVCLWGAVGPENEVYIYREYYNREAAPINEHANTIKEYSARDGRVIKTVADPESKQSIEDLCHERIPTVQANNDRSAGRMRVMEYLSATPEGPKPYSMQGVETDRKKWPRVYIFNTCKETTREFKFYRWKERSKVVREKEKETTEGEDHAMDTLRYLLMERPSPFKFTRRLPYNSFAAALGRFKNLRFLNSGNYIGRK